MSLGGVRESISRQVNGFYGGTLQDLLIILDNIEDIISNAKLIDSHKDKYKGTVRENEHLIQMDVLVSAYRDFSGVHPVHIEIKHLDNAESRTYMTVALAELYDEHGIKKEEVSDLRLDECTPTSNLFSSELRLSDILRNGKTNSEDTLKYIPDYYLNKEQIESKRRALQLYYTAFSVHSIAPMTVKVSGYKRKDGTKVSSHVRH